MIVADLGLVATAWLLAYWVRFDAGLEMPKGRPPAADYVLALGVILPLWFVLLRRNRLYDPRRLGSFMDEAWDIARTSLSSIVLLLALSFFIRTYSFSRGAVMIFGMAAPVLLVSLRWLVRKALRSARRRGYNLRFALVLGEGSLAEEVIKRIREQADSGLQILGVLADGPPGRRVASAEVIGQYMDLKPLLAQQRVDYVIVALSGQENGLMDKILKELDDELVSVMIAPDLMRIATLNSAVENLDGLPIIHLRSSPLVGWSSVKKRSFDVLGSALGLVAVSPIWLLVTAGILMSSGRPVFYTQKRMGLDGHVFRMLKFRTMRVESQTQAPGWSHRYDPRRTRFGRWLRRFSFDEMPQLWNVLKGDMSLVGPRPEQVSLIEEFRREVPGYMLRHKVKSGMTGWAQVHGWRGDTSLHRRIEHDIYYIQNWSIGLDVEILLMTVGSVIRGRNAY
ncbi:MAG: undecaprenyl-phosphate glucose phosphotransferase [Myxococcota bacterium]